MEFTAAGQSEILTQFTFVHLFSPQHSSNMFGSAFGLRKRSQLSAVKHTFTGDSFQNHDARTVQAESHEARLNG